MYYFSINDIYGSSSSGLWSDDILNSRKCNNRSIFKCPNPPKPTYSLLLYSSQEGRILHTAISLEEIAVLEVQRGAWPEMCAPPIMPSYLARIIAPSHL